MRVIYFCLLALLITSCTEVIEPHQSNIKNGNLFATSKPSSLRAIDQSLLVLDLTINDTTTRYNGTDFSDEVWSIDLALEKNTNYSIGLKWLALDHLLLHEFGEFFTDVQNPDIQLDLEFADEGTDRFDSDCDGVSNLKEFELGTDAGVATDDICPSDETIANDKIVYLVRNNLSFLQSGYAEVITSYVQDIKVRAFESSHDSWYWVRLANEEPFVDATEAVASLHYTKALGKFIYFEINKDAVSATAELKGVCGELNADARFCRVPFNWEEERWYTLTFELVDVDVWQASVFDTESGETHAIGKIQVAPGLAWNKPRFGVSYRAAISSLADCDASLPRVAMHTKSAKANGVFNMKSSTITVSRCVDAGLGWRAGTKLLDDGNLYALSIGDGR